MDLQWYFRRYLQEPLGHVWKLPHWVPSGEKASMRWNDVKVFMGWKKAIRHTPQQWPMMQTIVEANATFSFPHPTQLVKLGTGILTALHILACKDPHQKLQKFCDIVATLEQQWIDCFGPQSKHCVCFASFAFAAICPFCSGSCMA